MDALDPALGVVETTPAGGVETAQIVIGGGVIGALTTLLLVLGLAHRARRTDLLDRAAAPLVRRTGLPAWAVLPAVVSLVALVAAGPGFVWDVALHMANGRDAGPFANPSHYGLIIGTFGFFTAGWLAVVMPRGDAGSASVRIASDWRAPAAGVAMLACGSFSLLGFPLDDVWHNLFGQDVTLWGPTHLMMITGGLLHGVAAVLLLREGRLAAGVPRPRRGGRRRVRQPVLILAGGALLAGLTIAYQQEFGYGLPQFRLTFHPMLIALSAALVLVPVRLAAGRGAALATAAVAVVVQALLTGLVALGEPVLHFPPYVAEAVLVELAALTLARRPYALGAVAGALIGSIGTVAEWGWSHLWMPIPWPAQLLPEAIALSVTVAALGGVAGAFCGCALRAGAGRGPAPSWSALARVVAAIVVIVGVLATQLPTRAPQATASVELTEAVSGSGRSVHATVRFDRPAVAEGADWLYGMAWQGGEDRLVSAPLRRVDEGLYRTTEPLPAYGTWKSMVRLHSGDLMASVPVYLPADSAIPAPAVPAPPRFERALTRDSELLQRERKPSVDGSLWPIASALLAGAVVALVTLILWTLLRVGRAGDTSASMRSDGRVAPAPPGRLSGVRA